MKSQRGSILVGVIGLSLVMTVAATGLVMITTNSANVAEYRQGDVDIHAAAEAGMQMGVAWIRNYHPNEIDSYGGSQRISPTDFVILNGYTVNDSITCLLPPAVPECRLIVTATLGPQHDSLTITWDMVNSPMPGGPTPFNCTPTMSNWQETLTPGTL